MSFSVVKRPVIIFGLLLFVAVILSLLHPWRGFRETQYVGMTRDQIIAECPSYDRFDGGKIMILVGSAFHYFNTTAEIQTNTLIMQAPQWGVNFKKGLTRTRYVDLYFENDIVIKQVKSWYGHF